MDGRTLVLPCIAVWGLLVFIPLLIGLIPSVPAKNSIPTDVEDFAEVRHPPSPQPSSPNPIPAIPPSYFTWSVARLSDVVTTGFVLY